MSEPSTTVLVNDGVRGPEIPPRASSKRNSAQTDGFLVIDAKETPSLEGIVDLTNSVDTTVHTRQLPAVTHEYVSPTVQHIREEKITREIHYHDVYHRIQPVIDVEILPTKHYVQTKDGSLKEIPVSAIQNRQNFWHIATGPGPCVPASANADLKVASSPTTERISEPVSPDRNPIQISHRTISSTDGVYRTETTWRHAAEVLEVRYGGEDSTSSGEDDNYGYNPPSVCEEPQFRDRGYDNNGNLPGLQECSLLAVPRSSSTASGSMKSMKAAMERAPHTLRKMKAQLSARITEKTSDSSLEEARRDMEGLSVRD